MGGKEEDDKADNTMYKAAGWCLMQGCSSVSLMMFNKYLATFFNYPILTLIMQNSVATMLSIACWSIGIGPTMKPWKKEHFMRILPMAAIFTVLLYTSFQTMGLVAISTVVIFRNAGPLFTAAGENYIRKEQFSNRSLGALSMMIVGAFVYGFNDLQFDYRGYMWASFNLLCNTAAGLFGKHLSMDLKNEQSGLGLACYQNIVSVPLFMLVATLTGELGRWHNLASSAPDAAEIPRMVWITGFLSCMACVTMGVSTFELQRCVSQATVSVANVSYKLITLIVGVFVFGNNIGLMGVVGLSIAQGSAVVYVYERQYGQTKKEAAQPHVEAKKEEEVPLTHRVVTKEPSEAKEQV